MKLRSKWVLFLLSLFILVLLLQSGFHYFFKASLILSSFLALCLIAPLLLLLVKSFVSPLLTLTRKAKDLAAGRGTQEVFSGDEWEDLSRAISEVSAQSRERIEEITREKEYHQAILGGMTEGVLLVDRRGRTLLVNEALKKLIAIPTNVNDKTTLEIIRSVELEEAVQDALHKGTNKTLEITLPSSGEKTFEVNVVGIPSPPREGERPAEEARGVIVAFHDISRLKNLERIRQDFVANVSHELRTPLATIKGYAETLLDGAWKEEVAFQFIQVIKRHTDRLTKIVEDLLTLSRIESKGFQLKTEQVSIFELITDAVEFVKEGVEKKGISISSGEVSVLALCPGGPKLFGTGIDQSSGQRHQVYSRRGQDRGFGGGSGRQGDSVFSEG